MEFFRDKRPTDHFNPMQGYANPHWGVCMIHRVQDGIVLFSPLDAEKRPSLRMREMLAERAGQLFIAIPGCHMSDIHCSDTQFTNFPALRREQLKFRLKTLVQKLRHPQDPSWPYANATLDLASGQSQPGSNIGMISATQLSENLIRKLTVPHHR